MAALEFAEIAGSTIARSDKMASAHDSVVDLAIIRKRVAAIKRGWTAEVAKLRAAEGEKRRNELYRLLIEIEAGNGQDGGRVGPTTRNKFGLVG